MIGTTIGHYTLLERIGSGGMGEVYRAADKKLGREVALKALKPSAMQDPIAVGRFMREAQAASQLNHANIVTIHETIEQDGHFIVMELIRGQSLRQFMMPEKPMPLAQVQNIGKQIAQALAAAHDGGIVHRDIKPENIMIRDDGVVKILDFGLARLAPPVFDSDSAPASTLPENPTRNYLSGTLRYMSPEQARLEQQNFASDVFSLGRVLYEMLTGFRPFEANSPLEEVHLLLSGQPVSSIRRRNPEVPSSMDELVALMLHTIPEKRPAAHEVAGRLQQPADSVNVAASVVPHRKRLAVGREKELKQLQAVTNDVPRDRGVVFCIEGEAGIGKTTLVEEFLDELEQPVWAILRGRCSENLAGNEAYLPFVEALANLLIKDHTGIAAMQMKAAAPTWFAQASPLSKGANAPEDDRKAGSKQRFKLELLNFLRELSEKRRVVVFLDDLQWADAPTIELLGYLAIRFTSLKVAFVVTYRPAEMMSQGPTFFRIKADLTSRRLCRTLPLEFLTEQDVANYLNLVFQGNSFTKAFAAVLHQKTEGSPLFLIELLEFLKATGVIALEQQWRLTRNLADIRDSVPASLIEMIREKLGLLSEKEHRLLSAASVQGDEFDSATLAGALHLKISSVEEHLRKIQRGHALIRKLEQKDSDRILPNGTLTTRYRFVHALIRHGCYNALDLREKVDWSLNTAKALIANHEPHTAPIAHQLAHLFETARQFGPSVQNFQLAAQNASQMFAYRECLALAKKGLDLLKNVPEGPDRVRLELALTATMGVPLQITKGYGDPEVQRTTSKAYELCEQLGDNPRLFPILFALSSFYTATLHFEKAREIAEQMERIGTAAPLRMQTLLQKSVIEFYAGNIRAALAFSEEGRSLYDPVRDRSHAQVYGYDPGIGCRCIAARSKMFLGYPETGAVEFEEIIKDADRIGHPFTTVWAHHHLSSFYCNQLDVLKTENCSRALFKVATSQGFRFWIPLAKFMHGWALAESKATPSLVAKGILRMRQALEFETTLGRALARASNLTILSEIVGKQGNLNEALTMLDASEKAAVLGPRYFLSELNRLRGEFLSKKDAADVDLRRKAKTFLEQAVQVARDQNNLLYELRSMTSYAEYELAFGDRGKAATLLQNVCDRFIEGRAVPDFRRAGETLSKLRASHVY